MKIIITIEVDDKDVNVTTETTEEVKTEVLIDEGEKKSENGISQYARFFDEGCIGWTKNAEYNKMYLLQQQSYANDMQRARGHLFLNDVYDLLGMPRSKAGQVVGWIYDEANPMGDNFVDFGLQLERNANFINGYERCVLLDFNVDGNILDRI